MKAKCSCAGTKSISTPLHLKLLLSTDEKKTFHDPPAIPQPVNNGYQQSRATSFTEKPLQLPGALELGNATRWACCAKDLSNTPHPLFAAQDFLQRLRESELLSHCLLEVSEVRMFQITRVYQLSFSARNSDLPVASLC